MSVKDSKFVALLDNLDKSKGVTMLSSTHADYVISTSFVTKLIKPNSGSLESLALYIKNSSTYYAYFSNGSKF